MNRDALNKALQLILIAGEGTEAIDGYVYTAGMSAGLDLGTYNFAKSIAEENGLVEKTGANTFKNTPKGSQIAVQIKEARGA